MTLRNSSTRPVVVAAFEGWNDAGDAASGVITHLAHAYPTEAITQLDPDDFYDFQIVRPQIAKDANGPDIIWPTTRLQLTHLETRDLILVSGPEPNLRWRQFCSTILSAVRRYEPEMVIILGAMLSDSPHSRPLPVMASTLDSGWARSLGLEESDYQGPTGITGVLSDACHKEGMREISLWVSVPHYVAAPPNPKATLALLNKLEDLLEVPLELEDLPERAGKWQRGVDDLTSEDSEITEYIATLEDQHDKSGLAEASGDAIAREFERYLRHGGSDGKGWPDTGTNHPAGWQS